MRYSVNLTIDVNKQEILDKIRESKRKEWAIKKKEEEERIQKELEEKEKLKQNETKNELVSKPSTRYQNKEEEDDEASVLY